MYFKSLKLPYNCLFYLLNVVVVVVVVPASWSVSSYGPSQSTGTKQNPGGKVLNTGDWELFDIAPSEIECNDFQDIPGQKMSKDTTKK